MDALAKLLDLSREEKIERGLLYTPAEIAQQPATWESTFSIFQKHRTSLAEFLERTDRLIAGVKRGLDEMRGSSDRAAPQPPRQWQQQPQPASLSPPSPSSLSFPLSFPLRLTRGNE